MNSLVSINVTFSQAVVGVHADDLLINGSGANAVTGSGTAYTFTFTQPAPGLVVVGWDPENEITSATGVAFVSSGSWSYSLVDTVPPTISVLAPANGETLNGLTQAEVTFSESVKGVDATDLLVNGVAAASVSGTGAGKYIFNFPQPANGTVTFSWAAGHGITDQAGNAFAGGSWTATLNTALSTPNVIINEFLADNVSYPGKTTMMDEDGDFSPWIEIWNKGTTSVNLLGWSLTNDASNPGQWVFPATTLPAGQYLVVWASGKDRKTVTGSNLMHTNFTLATGGSYLALFPPALPRATTTTAFTPQYPVQRGDVSYGYDPSGALKYFSPSTFGTANGTSTITGIASPVTYSVKSGYFNSPFNLVISAPDAGATIRYTTDGSAPTSANGTTYSGSLNINTTSVVRVVSLSPTLLPSDTQTQSYFFPNAILSQGPTPAGYPITFPGGQPYNTWTPTAGTIENASRNFFQMDQGNVNDSTLYVDGPGSAGASRTNAQRIVLGLTSLPTVSVALPIPDLFDQTNGIYDHPTSKGDSWERAASMELIYPDGSQSNQQVNCGVQIQGGSSRSESKGFKHSFRLTFKDDYGTTKYSQPVFKDSSVSSFNTFVLDGGSNYCVDYDGVTVPTDQRQRAQGIRDAFTSDLYNAMGWPSFHSRFANIFLNGLYWGLDYIHERPDDDWAASYFGGDNSQYNVYKDTSSGFEVVAGDTAYADWKAMFTNYITPVCNTSGSVVGTLTNTNYQALQQVLDVTAFADYMIVNLYTGNDDWPQHNWYVSKKTTADGRFRFTVWDAEDTLKGATATDEFDNYNNGDGGKGGPGTIWGALRTNAEFRLLFADRLAKHFFNAGVLYVNPAVTGYDPAHPENNRPAAFYMNRATEVTNAVAGEYARWGTYTAQWAPSNGGGNTYTRNNQWITELNNLLGLQTTTGYTSNYFPTRSANVLGYFRSRSLFPATGINAPVYGQFGGRVVPGYNLPVAVPTGSTSGSTIYYTLDGTDPRTYSSGAPATPANGGTALVCTTGKVVLNTAGAVEVKSRALYGSTWSPLTDATFTVGSPAVPLRITELMYNPSPGGSSGSNYEYLEIQNVGTQTLNIGGYYFDGVDFVFPPNTTLDAGARLVLANNGSPTAWQGRYPGVSVAGWYGGSLSNSGERIAIFDSTGRVVTSVTYGVTSPWPTSPAGTGPSLEVIDPFGDPNDPSNWRASAAAGGTPGLAPATVTAPPVEISEVLAKNVSYPINGVLSDWLELRNTTTSAVNIGGWKLANSSSTYTLPSGTTIAASSYLVILCTKTNPGNGTLYTNFKVSGSAAGDELELYDNSTPAVRMDGIGWGQQIADLSIAKIGGVWQLAAPTPNAATTTPTTLAPSSSLVINEWLTNPLAGTASWFELYNSSASLPVALQGLYAQIPSQLGRFNALSFLSASGFLQVFTDSLPGGNHLDFTLPTTATTLSLLDATGTVLNSASLSALPSNVSQGHLPDGAATTPVVLSAATPGATNFQSAWTGPVWNEVMALDTLDAHPGWVELYNPNATAYDVSGLKVGNTGSATAAWTIPAGTSVAANAYLVFWCDGTQPASSTTGAGMNTGFSLNGSSGGIYLFNAAGQPVNQVQWGFQVPNLSIGLVSSTWGLLASSTPGAANSMAANTGAVGNLRINEWLASEDTGNDWFELYNLDPLPVAMAGLFLTDDPSTTGVGQFQVAPLSYIGGQSWVKYETDSSPASGSNHVNFKLSESGEYLQISANDGNYTPIDAVSFGQQTLNVTQGRIPDGQMVQAGLTPTPGARNVLPPAPSITGQPTSMSVAAGSSPTLSVTASGSAPLVYQWKFNGTNLSGATSASLALNNVGVAQDGLYTCVVTNTAGTALSSAARLVVSVTFNQWASYYGLGTNPAPNADSDGDGITNLQEYFHNLNPNAAASATDRAALPQVALEAATQSTPRYLTLTFRQSARATLSNVALQASSDLVSGWTAVTPDVQQILSYDAATGDPIVRWKVIVPSDRPQDFLRLQLTP